MKIFHLLTYIKIICFHGLARGSNVCLVTKKLRKFLKIAVFLFFFIFLANCCLVMASLTFSALSGITLLFLLVLGMILIPLEWVSSNCIGLYMIGKRPEIDLTSWINTHSEGIKIIPKTSKNSKVIPELAEKVRLAITRQQLVRNMKKNQKNSNFFLVFLVFW